MTTRGRLYGTISSVVHGTLVLVLFLAGCWGDEKTKFPEGLEPLEENTAPAPAGTAEDPHPETIELVDGTRMGFAWVHGRGFVHAPITTVWAAAREPEVCVDRRKVARWSVEHVEMPDEQYDFEYVIHNEVDDVITVEFDITWRHGAVEGTLEAPELVVANYQKTWGTTFISILRGTVVLTPVDETTTEVALVEHLRASASDGTEVRSYLRDYFESIVARSHGAPLPTY